MMMPVEAELDWMIIVTTSPISSAPSTAPNGITPSTGVQSNRSKSRMTDGNDPIEVSSSLMIDMPKKRKPNPSTVSPMPRMPRQVMK